MGDKRGKQKRLYLNIYLDANEGAAREWRGELTQERDKRSALERMYPYSFNKIPCFKMISKQNKTRQDD